MNIFLNFSLNKIYGFFPNGKLFRKMNYSTIVFLKITSILRLRPPKSFDLLDQRIGPKPKLNLQR